MPAVTKHPVATHMRERAMFDSTHLDLLLKAYSAMLCAHRWKAAKAMEAAIHAFREDEIGAFAEHLERNPLPEGGNSGA